MKTKFLQKSLVILAIGGLALLAVSADAQSATALPYGASQIAQLAQAKVSDDTILAYIKNSNNSYDLDAGQIIYLKQQGVSDAVISTMLNQPRTAAPVSAPAAPATATVAPQTTATANATVAPTVTYVQTVPATTYYYASPSYYYPYPYYGYGYSPVSVSLGFGWGGGWHGGYGGWHGGYGGGWHGGGGWHH